MRAEDRPELGLIAAGKHRAAAIAIFELALCVIAVALDLLLPTLIILAIATLSLRLRREHFASLGFRRPEQPWRLVAIVFALAVG